MDLGNAEAAKRTLCTGTGWREREAATRRLPVTFAMAAIMPALAYTNGHK